MKLLLALVLLVALAAASSSSNKSFRGFQCFPEPGDTSAAIINDIVDDLASEIAACESALFKSSACASFYARSAQLIVELHKRGCDQDEFVEFVSQVVGLRSEASTTFDSLASDIAELEGDLVSSTLLPPLFTGSTTQGRLEGALQYLIDTFTTTEAGDPLTGVFTMDTIQEAILRGFLQNEANFWDDAERDQALADILAATAADFSTAADLITTEIDGTQIPALADSLIDSAAEAAAPGTTMEERIITELADLVSKIDNTYQGLEGRLDEIVTIDRELWMEQALSRTNNRPTVVEFMYPSADGKVGRIEEVDALVVEKSEHAIDLGLVPDTTPIPQSRGYRTDGDFRRSWKFLSRAYNSFVVLDASS